MSGDTPDDTRELLDHAIEHHRRGEFSAAEAAYQAVLEREPENPDAIHLLGVIFYKLGNIKHGIEGIQRSLEINPRQPGAWNNLGNMFAETDRLQEAIDSYREAIELKPDHADAHHNLGNVLADVDDFAEAISSYQRAIELEPGRVNSRLGLASSLESIARFDEAAEALRIVLARQPDSSAVRKRLGSVLRKAERLDEAREVYDECLALDPEDAVAAHLRAACEPETAPAQASPAYLKQTFDPFADEFEERLRDLNYQVPELFREVLAAQFADQKTAAWTIGDLGCGTGLCGASLRDYASQLIGIDLSSGMLSKAAQLDLYDELVEAELVEHLLEAGDRYDLLVAGDTLEYFGDLVPVLSAAATALRVGGYLLVTLEKLNEDCLGSGYMLCPSGRYAHTEEYARNCFRSANLVVSELKEIQLRIEGKSIVEGLMILARKH